MNRTKEIQRYIYGKETFDGASVKIKRFLGGQNNMVDPFLLFDELYSDDPTTYIKGFPPHPHRGFETVTYLIAGKLHHRDSKGHEGHLGPLCLQWMTAGKGIIHSEMPEQKEGLFWGYQIWINLPSSLKMTEPKYQDFAKEEIPEIQQIEGYKVRVLAGEYQNNKSPVRTFFPVLFLDVDFHNKSLFYLELPKEDNTLLFCLAGKVSVGKEKKELPKGVLAILGEGNSIHIEGNENSRILLLSATPLKESVVFYGPFVMNRPEEIYEACRDYEMGILDK